MSFNKTNPYEQYKQTEVESLSQGKLIVLLYEGAIGFLESAIKNCGDFKKYDQVNNKLIKVQDIITELMVSLNVEEGGEIANNLLGIYVYLKKTLIESNIEKDKVKMEEVHKHLILLKDAWLEIEKKAEVNVQKKLPEEPINEGGISFTG